ncbi:MAG: hypothetical protein PHY33_06375 [Methanobacteriaceae archaeon]|nr:hypothetical protein [Methanobacteriaceae archaeon]
MYSADGYPDGDWYYIVNPDELEEALYLRDLYIYKVYNSGGLTCSDLNKLVEEVHDDLIEEYCDCDYSFNGDDVIDRINEKFSMELELEYCPDIMFCDEEDIFWDEEEKLFSEPDDFNTVWVNHFWDFKYLTWIDEIPDEIIEISDYITYTCLDDFYTGGTINHSYVAYLEKNQYLIIEESDLQYSRDIARIVNKKGLIDYLEDLNKDVNYYLKKIHP